MDDLKRLKYRRANRDDLPTMVGMLADDPLGAKRERFEEPLPASYHRAYETIQADPNNELIVAEFDGKVVGVMQITFIPTITYQGGTRAQIEGVRVAKDVRGLGVGKAFIEWAIEQARKRRCHLVQLTTDRKRPRTREFYEGLGFVASHEGMKMRLEERQ